jgi:hypothetical protein
VRYDKLTQDDVEEIHIELREGTSYNAIAKMFDTSYATIQNVNNGKYFRIPDMRYPIVDRRHKYGKEPGELNDFWDTYIPEPMHTLPVKLHIRRPPY